MRKRYIVSIVTIALLVAFAGCTRNPDAAKRKYVESGKKYMEEKQYDKAVIQFKKALQIDPRFSEGHYELCLLYTSPSPRDGATSRMPSSA